MVVCPADHGLQADVIFVVEGTAVNGAYINDLKTNYILPSLEYFSQGTIDEMNYMTDNANSLYGIVIYQAADCMPQPSSHTLGPFASPTKLLTALEKLELVGGKGESHANIAEGLATALNCFEELAQKRDATASASIHKHCILVCNSPPYMMPVLEAHNYGGKSTEQLAALLQDNGINLSVISPRKIPSLYKLFEKAGGDLSISQTKNYAKDPRHLVLLKGFSLKERPLTPPSGAVSSSNNPMPIASLPSPIASSDSPIAGGGSVVSQSLLNAGGANGVPSQVAPGNVFRPANPQAMAAMPAHANANLMVNQIRGGMMQGPHVQAPPGYNQAMGIAMGNRAPTRWMMQPPQQPQRAPFMQAAQSAGQSQGSALIAQLTQPPNSMSGAVNQFNPRMQQPQQLAGQMPQQQQIRLLAQQQQAQLNQQQQQQLNAQQQQQQPNLLANIQTSMANVNQQQQQQQQQQMMGGQQQSQTQQQIAPQSVANMAIGSTGRQTIWQGVLEWIEKPKVHPESQKITKQVQCSVSAGVKDGELELKADGWPQKLIMQLMPKQLIGNIGGAHLKNSKSVFFHPLPCEALDSLTKVMSSGFAGCVHFTSTPNPTACDIKVLILLYTAEKRAYLGFIPNDQVAFVDRLRKVIQQQKSTQIMRQGAAGSMNPQQGQMVAPNQLPNTSAPPGAMMLSQTNTMTMGGGQLTQNVVASPSQPVAGLMNPNMPGGPMQQRLRMPIPSQQQQQQQQAPPNQNMAAGGGSSGAAMMAARPAQPFANQLEAERQANLDKINQLKQTLEVAQQQEQQYKNQLERISHMKTQQLQEALQIAQQQELQYKMLDQQRMSGQGNPQGGPVPQQQRMMRPGPVPIANNPGLRTLLQQQPQYRPQMMGQMHQMGANMQPTGPRPTMAQQMGQGQGSSQVNFDDVNSFDYFSNN